MDSKTTKQLINALYGISVAKNWPAIESGATPLANNTRPPSYIIQLVLEALHGERLPKGVEKCAWELPIDFEESAWLITDWKHYAWRLFSQSGSKESCIRLQKKLEAAGGIVDNYLATVAKTHLDNDDFSLKNDYNESKSLYQYYRHRLDTTILIANPATITGPPGEQRSALVNEYYRALREAEQNQIVTSIFFFAHSEIILDSCFALQEPGRIRYRDFRALDWGERFKIIVGDVFIRQYSALYSHLLEIRRYFRNIPVHASPQFLFPVEGVGLVPATFNRLDDPRLSYGHRYDTDEGKRILRTFDLTLELLRDSPRTACGYLYAESALPIHIKHDLREELQKLMSSMDSFKQELDRRVQLHYAKINGEI